MKNPKERTQLFEEISRYVYELLRSMHSYVYVSVSVSASVSVFVHVCMYVCMHVCIYTSVGWYSVL